MFFCDSNKLSSEKGCLFCLQHMISVFILHDCVAKWLDCSTHNHKIMVSILRQSSVLHPLANCFISCYSCLLSCKQITQQWTGILFKVNAVISVTHTPWEKGNWSYVSLFSFLFLNLFFVCMYNPLVLLSF